MVRRSSMLLPLVLLLGCDPGVEEQTNEDLTSKAAVERQLNIKAYVYVDENASSYTVQDAVQRQVRTAFGPLRIGGISVDDREFRSNIDPKSFSKTVVEVVRTGADGTRTVLKKVARVSYLYQARALVQQSLASQSRFSMALLMGQYQSFVDQILKDCVVNYEEDREFSSSFWYVWAPNQSACKKLIQTEVDALAKERQGLGESQIGEQELARRYLPLAAELANVAAPKTTYPEYDRLYGLEDPSKSRIVVYQVVGVAAHDTDPIDQQLENDMGFTEYVKMFKVLGASFKTLKVAADSPTNPLAFTFQGKSYTASWNDLNSWVVNQSSFPAGVTDTRAFRRAIHDNVKMRWVKLEVPLTVSSARGSKKMTLEMRFIFGTEGSWGDRSIWKEAFKNADVALYDGHSYIGSGPLDPGNYASSDFNGRYQILFFNSCVSFNYYGVNYFKLKTGGTKNLELVTNGLEVHINDGGKSMGQFIAALFDGKQNSWLAMLDKTAVKTWYGGVHDPNRSVDGELDNVYSPVATPITVVEGGGQPPQPVTVKNLSSVCGKTAQGTVELAATAENATRVEFLVAGKSVGTDSAAPYTASWNTATTADGQVTVTARATGADGTTAEESCSVTVQNGGTTKPLFFDDMESGSTAWTATGLWHLAQNSACASPGFASASRAWYFGQDSTCNYKQSGTVKGTLTSRPISGVTATSKLSFRLYREVEKTSGSYDRTLVEVQADGAWKTIWSRDSKVASTKTWESSGDLSLAEYAGKSIVLRFSFDSVDSYDNAHTGWLIDDVIVSP